MWPKASKSSSRLSVSFCCAEAVPLAEENAGVAYRELVEAVDQLYRPFAEREPSCLLRLRRPTRLSGMYLGFPSRSRPQKYLHRFPLALPISSLERPYIRDAASAQACSPLSLICGLYLGMLQILPSGYRAWASTKRGSIALETTLSKSSTVQAYSGPGPLQPGTKMGATEGFSAPMSGRK